MSIENKKSSYVKVMLIIAVLMIFTLVLLLNIYSSMEKKEKEINMLKKDGTHIETTIIVENYKVYVELEKIRPYIEYSETKNNKFVIIKTLDGLEYVSLNDLVLKNNLQYDILEKEQLYIYDNLKILKIENKLKLQEFIFCFVALIAAIETLFCLAGLCLISEAYGVIELKENKITTV